MNGSKFVSVTVMRQLHYICCMSTSCILEMVEMTSSPSPPFVVGLFAFMVLELPYYVIPHSHTKYSTDQEQFYIYSRIFQNIPKYFQIFKLAFEYLYILVKYELFCNILEYSRTMLHKNHQD